MDHSAGLTGKTSLEKINIPSAKKQLLLKKQKNTIGKMQVLKYIRFTNAQWNTSASWTTIINYYHPSQEDGKHLFSRKQYWYWITKARSSQETSQTICYHY